MPTLSDSNVKTICAAVKTRGFTVKYWQDHRSMFAKGQGAAAAVRSLIALGMDASGSPKGTKNSDLAKAYTAYESLMTSFNSAKQKAKSKKGTHTG